MRIPQTPFMDVKYNWIAHHNSKSAELSMYSNKYYMRYTSGINSISRYQSAFNPNNKSCGWAWGIGLRLGKQTK